MVTKIPTRSPAVSINSKTTTETANRLNIDDDFFETGSENEYLDTYQTLHKKSANPDDGKISTGEFISEYFTGMWENAKKQGKGLINTLKKHPMLATGAVIGTIAAAAYFPIISGILGGVSVGMGIAGLVKNIGNGVEAYNKYKNAKTDNDAKEQVREIGANTLNTAENIILTLLGGKALLKPCNDWYIMKIERLISKKRFVKADFLKEEPALYMNETLNLKQIKNAVIEHFDDGCQSTVIFNSITKDNKN